MRLLMFAFALVHGVVLHAQYRIQGTVVDSQGLEPVPHSIVGIDAKTTICDHQGRFQFSQIEPGQKELHIQVLGKTYHHFIFLRGDTTVVIKLPLAPEDLSGVVVYGHIHDTDETPGLVYRIPASLLEKKAAVVLSDALDEINGVDFLRTGSSIAKPMIDGMHSNRILIFNGGSRLENQQWGSEHAPGLDPLSLGAIEVVKGASTLLYGNDAIGGVIRVEPLSFPDSTYKRIKVFTKLASNPRMGQLGLQWESFDEQLHWGNRIALNAVRAGDQLAADYVLSNTGFSQISGAYQGHFHLDVHHVSINLSSFNQELGILAASHIGNLSDLEQAIGRDTPLVVNPYSFDIRTPYQLLGHHTAQIRWEMIKSQLGDLKLDLSHQWNLREEFDRHLNIVEPALSLSLQTSQLNLYLDKHWEHWRLEYGGMLERQQNNFSGRYFIPNYLRYKIGIYAVGTYNTPVELFQIGARYDDNRNRTYRWERDTLKRDPFLFSGPSASMSYTRRFADHYRFTISASHKFRAPQVNELFSDGLHHGSASLEYGDLNLKKERSNSISMALQHLDNRWQWILEPFIHRFYGFIYLAPSGETQLSIRGAFPVFEYRQTDLWYSGLNLGIDYRCDAHWELGALASGLYVVDVRGDYIYGLPPPKIRSKIHHRFIQNYWFGDAFITLAPSYVARQVWVDYSADYTSPPKGYFLLDLEFGKKLASLPINLLVGVNNILNTDYRDYLNRYRYFAQDQGISFFVTLNYALKL